MKSILFAAAALAAFTTGALAADAIATTEPVSTYNWSGAYVDGQIGYGWGNDKWSFQGIDYTVPAKPEGFLGGIYGGYNWRLGDGFVVGADADFTFSDMKKSGTTVITAAYRPPVSAMGRRSTGRRPFEGGLATASVASCPI